MSTRSLVRLLLAYLLLGRFAVCQADMTLKTRTVITDSGAASNVENPNVLREIDYRHGALRRKDSLGDKDAPSISSLANCETKTGFLIDWDAHEYRTYKVVRFLSEAQLHDFLLKNRGKAIQIESRTVDTGERKTFFGHSAKHLITTTKRPANEKGAGGEEITNGWYIDHQFQDNDCAPDYVRTELFHVLATTLVTYPEVPQFHHTGPLPTGLAVKETRTVREAGNTNGRRGRTITIEVTTEELLDSPLKPSLFELPPGFHENPQLWERPSTHR